MRVNLLLLLVLILLLLLDQISQGLRRVCVLIRRLLLLGDDGEGATGLLLVLLLLLRLGDEVLLRLGDKDGTVLLLGPRLGLLLLHLGRFGARLLQPPAGLRLLSRQRGFQLLRRHRFDLIVKLKVVVVVLDLLVLLGRVHAPPPRGGEDHEGSASGAAFDDGAQGEPAARVADQARVLHAVPVASAVVEGERLQAAAATVGPRAHAVRGGDAGEGAHGEHRGRVVRANVASGARFDRSREGAPGDQSLRVKVLNKNLAGRSKLFASRPHACGFVSAVVTPGVLLE